MRFNVIMKKFFLIISTLVIFVVISLSGFFYWWNTNSQPPSLSSETVRFVIPKGLSAMQTANKLYQSGIIKSPIAFKIYVQFTDKSRQIKPGEYNLPVNLKLTSVIEKILKGPDEIWIIVPEGLRREEIAKKIISQLSVEDDNFFYEQFMTASSGMEGYLFPDTYLFPPDIDAANIVLKMNSTFKEKYQELLEQTQSPLNKTQNELVTMASIIERETKSIDERSIVAGILWKRLDTDGWLLQADATVQYAIVNSQLKTNSMKLENYWPILTKEDLEIDSPFNSYKYKEIPPSPISNPGIDSIKAALFPSNSDYWFYIHDSDGVIHYAKTLSQHNQNIAKYLNK